VVFNGSDLGKAYSAKGLFERLSPMDRPKTQEKERRQQHGKSTTPLRKTDAQSAPAKTYLEKPAPTNYLQLALGKSKPEALPGIPKKKKKKKKGPEQSPSREI
jgi:hypothetical protein